MITIVDYQAGNLGSIQNMLKRIGVESKFSSDPLEIEKAQKLILPGVGSFDYGMSQLNQSGLIEALNRKVLTEKTPILGICLGLQLFTKSSEEGKLPGLGWIDAETVKFDASRLPTDYKIPNMGWNEVNIKKENKIHTDQFVDARFYFVHSYHLKCNNESDILYTADYGYEFVCGIEKENMIAVQFHPEKSHKFGMKLLDNFARLY